MSLDRIHDVNGLMQFSAQPVIGTTGTASTVASNLFPGGYQFGASIGFIAGTNSSNGGAQMMPYLPKFGASTDFNQSFSATSGTISHENVPAIYISVSTTGSAYSLMPAAYDGQLLSVNVAGNTGSIVTGITSTGLGGTTTAACSGAMAFTFSSAAGFVVQAVRFSGLTATTNLPLVWRRLV